MRGPQLPAGQVEVATVHVQVLANGQLQVEIVLLGHHAEPGPDGRAIAIGIQAEDPQLPAAPGRNGGDHAHGGALAGAVGPEEAERLATLHREVDAVDGSQGPERLGQAARVDQRFATHHPFLSDRPAETLVQLGRGSVTEARRLRWSTACSRA